MGCLVVQGMSNPQHTATFGSSTSSGIASFQTTILPGEKAYKLVTLHLTYDTKLDSDKQ